MAKNKTLKVLSTGTVAGMIAAAVLSSQAFAAVDAYSVKIGDDVLKYDKAALTESFLASKAGEAAPLYEDFTAKLTEAKGFYAFSDAKTGKFVSYDDIQAKFLEAKAAGEAFVVDAYTESADAKVIEVPTVKKVVVKDGKVVVETESVELKVEAVSAINATTLNVTGTALEKLAATDVTVSDNTVKSVTASADGKSATIKLDVELLDGEEATIKIGEKTFTATYKLQVKTVEVKAASYDDNTSKQYIKLVVGGQEVTASDLIAAGYDVQFDAYEDKNATTPVSIFEDGETSESGLLSNAITEGDSATATGETFYVGVTITKGSEVLSSSLAKITIKNMDLATETIESVTLRVDGEEVDSLSNTILTNETASIRKIKVKTDSVSENIEDTTLFTAKSSNTSVATVKDNVITPVAPGKATITVTYGNATKAITITVADDDRELDSIKIINKDDVTYGTQISAKTITLAGGKVYVKLLDQYGDLFASTDVTAHSSNESIVTTGDLEEGDVANRIYVLELGAVDAGSAYITFKEDGYKVNSNTLKITVTENDTVSTRKLELDYADGAADKLKDTKINIGDEEDTKLIYELIGYTSQNVKIGAEALTDDMISIAQSGAVVTAVANGDGNLEITGLKKGTATVTVTFAGKKYSQTVTVVDEPTKISSITLKSIAKPTYAKEYTYKDVFTYTASGNDPILKNVTVTPATSQPVRYDIGANTIYLDKNANGVNDGDDVELGSIVFTFVDEDGDTNGSDNSYTTVSGDEGTLIFKVLDASSKVIKSLSVDIDL